jgi:hypothetical protein
MGHYSLWPIFQQFDLDSPVAVESRATHICAMEGNVPHKVHNDYSFPASCTVRFQFASKAHRPALDIFWYDGSMKPPTPPELRDADLEAEGMMFVGDQGKILAGFLGQDARILSDKKMKAYGAAKEKADSSSKTRSGGGRTEAISLWAQACKGGPATYGSFLHAQPISDAINLAAVSLRTGGKRLLFDAATPKITNLAQANKYLSREYRKGWELTAV